MIESDKQLWSVFITRMLCNLFSKRIFWLSEIGPPFGCTVFEGSKTDSNQVKNTVLCRNGCSGKPKKRKSDRKHWRKRRGGKSRRRRDWRNSAGRGRKGSVPGKVGMKLSVSSIVSP